MLSMSQLHGFNAEGEHDPYWENVILYLPFDSNFTCLKGNVFTQWVGTNAIVSNGKYGNCLSGATNSCIYCQSNTFDFPAGPFTVEGYFYTSVDDQGNNNTIIEVDDGGPGLFGLYAYGADQELVMVHAGESTTTATGVYTASAWNYFRLIRDSADNLKLYVNGILRATKAGFVSTALNTTIYIAGSKVNTNETSWLGLIDEIIITQGIERTGPVPTAPFPRS